MPPKAPLGLLPTLFEGNEWLCFAVSALAGALLPNIPEGDAKGTLVDEVSGFGLAGDIATPGAVCGVAFPDIASCETDAEARGLAGDATLVSG